jgi:para-aminobenzoate synthetase/4-amino-4-deoxychorismate lyase
LPIRTAWIDRARGVATYGTGGGITWDSTPGGEYDEAVAKAALLDATAPVPTLLETMRLDAEGYARRERHLARLARSAAYHATPIAADTIAAALDAHAREHRASLDAGEVRRARLLVAPDGAITVESAPLVPAPGRPRVALARTPVSRADATLYHKTTSRATYDARRAEHPDAWDVLLWNEAGELTELTIGNVVLELDGTRVTPPVACGLLGGVLREELLERGEVAERALRIDDLERATRVWLVNSARGWVEVELGIG